MPDSRPVESQMPEPAREVLVEAWKDIEDRITRAHDDALKALEKVGHPAEQAQNDALSVIGQIGANAVLTLILAVMRDKGAPPQRAYGVVVADVDKRVQSGLTAAVMQQGRADKEARNGEKRNGG